MSRPLCELLCACCGCLLAKAERLEGEPESNGVCCPACLGERPELAPMNRAEVYRWRQWRRQPWNQARVEDCAGAAVERDGQLNLWAARILERHRA